MAEGEPAPPVRPGPSPTASTRWLRLGLLAVLAAGASFRLSHYLTRRSLWLDEAMLALNLAGRSFLELLRPLDYNQTAPPLFLWIERSLVALTGVNELALRAFPMAAGIAALALLWPVARRLTGEAGALAAVTLAAFSPALIRYANEAKPYGTDALVAVVLLQATLSVAATPGARRAWALLLVAGWLAILVSTPGVFVAGAVIASLLLHRPARERGWTWIAGGAALWAGTAALLYLLFYRPAATNPYQQQGYEAAFLFPGPGLGEKASLALRGTLLPTFMGIGSAIPSVPAWVLWLEASALLAGMLFVSRRNGRWAAVLLAAPLLLAALASSLRRYPLGVPRLMVFASPLLILMAGGAIAWLVAVLRPRARVTLLAAAGLACAAPMARQRLEDARTPFLGEDAASLVAAFREANRNPYEPVYVGARGLASWLFYTTDWKAPDRDRLAFYARAASSGESFENAPSRGRPVVNEGEGLMYPYRLRREILGISTGRQWRWPSYVTRDPDEGWAANEAARIAREANPCAWLYFTRLSERAHKPVMWHVRDTHRAQRDFEKSVPGGVLWRYCFPYTPERLARMERWTAEAAANEAARAERIEKRRRAASSWGGQD